MGKGDVEKAQRHTPMASDQWDGECRAEAGTRSVADGL